MEEPVAIGDGKFLRPRRSREDGDARRFLGLLKRAVRVAFVLLLVSFFLFLSHWVYVRLLEDPLFRVRVVEVSGCQRLPRETLLSLARIEGMPNLFTVRLKETVKHLESHPWIESVVIRKAFPNKVLIQIEERKPIAILQLESPYYIDAKGVIFSPVGDRDGYNFPFLTGVSRDVLEKDSEEAKSLIMKALEFLLTAEQAKVSPLEEISEIHLEKTHGLRCYSKEGGVEVKMGWDPFGEKLRRLSVVWADLRKRGFSAATIDCCNIDRMVVKRTSGKGEAGRR